MIGASFRPRMDDLHTLKDDMTAFIEGHGMRRFKGFVSEDVSHVMWDPGDHADGWKDFVELAKASGANFVTMSDVQLDKEDIDFLINRLQDSNYASDDELDDAKWLRTHVGKTGFVQIGFPTQGVMFLYEVSTDWYDRYQRLLDIAEDYGGFVIDEQDQDDER
jgi:hypothetical protein